jgi:hypothetical protein
MWKIVGVLPLEGEMMTENERLTAIEPERRDVDNETPDAEIPNPVPEATEGRGKRI